LLLFFDECVAQSLPKRPTREPMREPTCTLIPNAPPSQSAAELQTCILAGFWAIPQLRSTRSSLCQSRSILFPLFPLSWRQVSLNKAEISVPLSRVQDFSQQSIWSSSNLNFSIVRAISSMLYLSYSEFMGRGVDNGNSPLCPVTLLLGYSAPNMVGYISPWPEWK
jgi:hypothetical protein